VHRRTHGLGQRLRHIADATADQTLRGVGVRLREGFHAAGDFREEVTGFELVVVFVDVGHGFGKRARSVARRSGDAREPSDEKRLKNAPATLTFEKWEAETFTASPEDRQE